MLVRIILFLGVGLILFAGGAAGWQYWQQMQGAAPVAVAEATPVPVGPFATMISAPPPQGLVVPEQNWLISPGGGLVARGDVDAFLKQDQFVDTRTLRVGLQMPLTALLGPGEGLPDPVFAGVFADIRAPVLALSLCHPLLEDWASGCKVTEASADKDSYNPETGTAVFLFTLTFTQTPGAVPLPDLATVAYHSDAMGMNLTADTPEQALTALVAAAAEECGAREAAGMPCRITGLSLEWRGPGEGRASVQSGWLAPLPEGVYSAPPLF